MLDEGLVLAAVLLLEPTTQIRLGALHGLIQEIPQAHRVPGAGFQLLAVFPLDKTKGHVLQARTLGEPTGPAGHLEDSSEVVRLAGIGHVHNPAGAIAVGG